MLSKRHNRTMFVWLVRSTTHQTLPRGIVDSRTGTVTMHNRGGIPEPASECWTDEPSTDQVRAMEARRLAIFNAR